MLVIEVAEQIRNKSFELYDQVYGFKNFLDECPLLTQDEKNSLLCNTVLFTLVGECSPESIYERAKSMKKERETLRIVRSVKKERETLEEQYLNEEKITEMKRREDDKESASAEEE